jgi:hypothetical protein
MEGKSKGHVKKLEFVSSLEDVRSEALAIVRRENHPYNRVFVIISG